MAGHLTGCPRERSPVRTTRSGSRIWLKDKAPRPCRPSPRRATDTAEIIYTGGTTKFPKGVPISHGLYLESAGEQISICDPLFKPQDNVVLGSAPLFHILGQTCALSALLVGGAVVLMPKVNLDAIFDAIQRFRATSLIGVPTLYRMILEHDRIDFYDLSSLRYCFNGGDVLPEEIGNRWRKKFGRPIYQGYGATETCGGVTMCPTDEDNPPKSIGRVVPSKKVKLVDPATLEPVAPLASRARRWCIRNAWSGPTGTNPKRPGKPLWKLTAFSITEPPMC